MNFKQIRRIGMIAGMLCIVGGPFASAHANETSPPGDPAPSLIGKGGGGGTGSGYAPAADGQLDLVGTGRGGGGTGE